MQVLFVMVISVFTLKVSPSYAQIGELGIYGSPTIAYRANVRYVRLENYPGVEGGLNFILPVNGHKNFNFYYGPDGLSFLPGGGYKVTYLAADQTTAYGYDIVSYSPNSGYTNGVAVRAFTDPPSTPLGIHANVYGYDSQNNVVPLKYLNVYASLGSVAEYSKTNGDGYFTIYYTHGNLGGFLPYGDHWQITITGYQGGCTYGYTENGENVVWQPVTDPNSSYYYISGASRDLTSNIPTLSCYQPEG